MNDIPEIEITAEPYVEIAGKVVRGDLSANTYFVLSAPPQAAGADFEMTLYLPNGVSVEMRGKFDTEADAVDAFKETAQQIAGLKFGWASQ